MISDYLMYDLKTLQQYFSFFAASLFILVMQSCSVSKQINRQAHKILLQDSVINTGHIGISIYDPATNTYLYNYNADKYFVPASNVKLFTLYAGMKYLGDSLVGMRYYEWGISDYENPGYFHRLLTIYPSGDPTFLHPDFADQKVYEFLKKTDREIGFSSGIEVENNYGKGWAWDDYDEPFMPARSAFPIYGNVATIEFKITANGEYGKFNPRILKDSFSTTDHIKDDKLKLYRSLNENRFYLASSVYGHSRYYEKSFSISCPIIPRHCLVSRMLMDTLGKPFNERKQKCIGSFKYTGRDRFGNNIIYSRPTDSLFAPMMHNSDNFFAEQTLLMASNEHLGYMSDEVIIDSLLRSDLKDAPQQPRWVDGSGLSRYNLFTPQSLVYILTKMKNEFGLERLKTILPTGGQGTLKNYYQTDSGFIYAKTGSLSNQITLSGFLITKKNRLLAFSILANNVMGDGWKVRRGYEQFLKKIREQY